MAGLKKHYLPHQQWVEEALKQSKIARKSKWTQSIAGGDKSFLE